MLSLITTKDIEKVMPFVGAMNEKSMGRLMMAIEGQHKLLVESTLGTAVDESITAVDDSYIAEEVRCVCILKAFLGQIRSRDLILTDTGFGIVSNQNIAPASQARVDALKDELEQSADAHLERLILLLRAVEGWGDTGQAKKSIPTLFWRPSLLMGDMAGTPKGYPDHTFRLLESVQPHIHAAVLFLKKHLSDEFWEELLAFERHPSQDIYLFRAVACCREFIRAKVCHAPMVKAESYYEELMNFIEGNLEQFPTYANSEAYQLNHHEPYENKAHHPGYFFG